MTAANPVAMTELAHRKPSTDAQCTIFQQMPPNVYIIAGPNGAGKTTFARKFLPKYRKCPTFVNADLIAHGIAPFAPQAAAVRAGRIVLKEIASLAKKRVDFGFETTLSGRGYLTLMRNLRQQGYSIQIFFLYIPEVGTAISRIRERVLRGGHSVPEEDVHRRFHRSLRNFIREYQRFADLWILFDNSGPRPRVIASQKHGELRVRIPEQFKSLRQRYE